MSVAEKVACRFLGRQAWTAPPVVDLGREVRLTTSNKDIVRKAIRLAEQGNKVTLPDFAGRWELFADEDSGQWRVYNHGKGIQWAFRSAKDAAQRMVEMWDRHGRHT